MASNQTGENGVTKLIWKYQLPLKGETLDLPVGAEVLCVQAQRGAVCLWVMVSIHGNPTDGMREPRRFEVYGTGYEVRPDENHQYVGTAQVGDFVWHVFEVKP